MWTLLLAQLASAGTLVIDARVPVEVWLQNSLVGELATPAEIHIPAEVGKVEVTLVMGGRPYKQEVEIPATGAALVIVGRTGVTTGVREFVAPPATTLTSSAVQFRSAAREDVIVVLGKDRLTIAPGSTRSIDMAIGSTPLSLRDASGTVIWAHGTLEVGGEGLVVQVADGRLPETAGAGAFHPDP